jgi:hypothetical protein
MTSTSVAFRRVLPIVALALVTTGCEAIEGIFKAGVWTGVIAVVLLLAIIGFVAMRVRQP